MSIPFSASLFFVFPLLSISFHFFICLVRCHFFCSSSEIRWAIFTFICLSVALFFFAYLFNRNRDATRTEIRWSRQLRDPVVWLSKWIHPRFWSLITYIYISDRKRKPKWKVDKKTSCSCSHHYITNPISVTRIQTEKNTDLYMYNINIKDVNQLKVYSTFRYRNCLYLHDCRVQ